MKFKVTEPTLYMTCGIPGSGKSTYLRQNFPPEAIVSPDEIRKEVTGSISDQKSDFIVWKMVPERLKDSLKSNGIAVLDATNTVSKNRQRLLNLFPGVKKCAILFFVDPERSYERIRGDLEAKVDRSAVPKEVVERMHQQFLNGLQTIKQQFDEIIIAEKE